jgi:diketogulonate reductase-like aldo/keto reductase
VVAARRCERVRGCKSKAAQSPLEHRIVVSLAAKYRKTPAQIVLRWHVEHGLSAIPKSVRPGRIVENIDIFDFTLTRDDLATLDALDTDARGGPDPEIVNPKLFDLSIPDAT